MPDRARNNGVWQLSLKLILHVLQLLSFLNVTLNWKRPVKTGKRFEDWECKQADLQYI